MKQDEQNVRIAKKDECTSTCPVCGWDLSFQDNVCICKNKNCGWHCDKCRTEQDI